MIQKHKLAVLLLALAVAIPFSASAAQGGLLSTPFTGTATAANGAAVPIAGNFNITSFAVNDGKLVANGTLNFLLNGAQTVGQVAIPITGATGTCPVLNLSIGAVDLNLLGLVVHLNPINLVITAQSGPGNLLGNLVCAVANLLNGTGGLGGLVGGLLNQVSTLLNQLLAQL